MRSLVEQLYGGMPREFASPQRRAVSSTEELVALIDQYNGRSDVFVSAYPFATDERSYGDVLINKAVFDFDGEWDRLVRTHEWLEERGAAHIVVFSGSDASGHVYVLTEPTRHQQSLEYFQRDVVVDGAGLRTCRECGNPVETSDASAVARWRCPVCERRMADDQTRLAVDENLVGDPSTMIRVPNTWNPGAERFCVPLKPGEVTRDLGRVYSLAESQRDLSLSDVVSGENTPDITQKRAEAERLYDSYRDRRRLAGFESDSAAFDEFEAEVTPVEMMESLECECMRRLVLDADGNNAEPDLGHRHRRFLVSKLVEEGYNPEEIARFLRCYLSDEKADHSIAEEEQPIRIWRDGVKPPNKLTLKRTSVYRRTCPEHAQNPEVWAETEPAERS